MIRHDKQSRETHWLGLKPWVHGVLFLAVVAVPVLLSMVTGEVAFERSKSLQFCASCHAMDPYVNGLKDPDSELLSAKHYQYRRINHNQCYTCHTDYDFLGPAKAKVRGMRHVMSYYFGDKDKPIKLYKSFSNKTCLECHDGAKSFMKAEPHQEILEPLRSDEMSCISCHGPVHPTHQGAP